MTPLGHEGIHLNCLLDHYERVDQTFGSDLGVPAEKFGDIAEAVCTEKECTLTTWQELPAAFGSFPDNIGEHSWGSGLSCRRV